MKMSKRNEQLKTTLGAMAPVERVIEVNNIPTPDSVNIQGYEAYSLDDELRLLTMLNTLKLEPQHYRTESETMITLRDLIERIGVKDPYFICQAIKYSRCMRDGMRAINHLAAALVSPFISGQDYAKRFYSSYNKKTQEGGCIFRPDDMSEIKEVYNALNQSTLSNAMKKGFASAIEKFDNYQLAKYRKTIRNIANLVHPNSKKSTAIINVDGKEMRTLDAIMQGINVSADTWEVANSEAGQLVAQAVKDGKLDETEAQKILSDAKNDNWESLLTEGKLGILAALRNIRNMLIDPRPAVIEALVELISNPKAIRNGMIMPYQMDLGYEVVNQEFKYSPYKEKVQNALTKGLETAIPNLSNALYGKTLVMIDCSGSMHDNCYQKGKRINTTACEKAGLLTAMIAKATNCDVIRFGSHAEYANYNVNDNVFSLAKQFSNTNMGGTNIASAFEYARKHRKSYDRIILLSDNEANAGCTYKSYKNYVHDVCSPYIYAIDLAAYGTTPLKNDGKVNYYFGYGYQLFDDIATMEFNPKAHIDKVRQVKI